MARGRVFQREPGRGRPWSYVVDAELGSDGRRRQRKRGGFRTRAEAEIALRNYLSDRDAGRPSTVRSGRTLAEWLQEWLETKKGSVKPTTLESYRYAIRAFIVPRIGALHLQDLRPVHLQRFYNGLSEEGGSRGGQPSPRSVHLAHQVLRPALGHAVDLGLLPANPAASKLVLPRIKRREMTVWSAEEAGTFLEATAEDRFGALWRLILTTGLRRGEALGLRWADVDVEKRSISVSQNLVMVGAKPTLSSPKGRASPSQLAADDCRRVAPPSGSPRQGSFAGRTGLVRPRSRVHDGPRRSARSQQCLRPLYRLLSAGRGTGDPPARRPPHGRNPGTPGRCSPQTGARDARPCLDRDDPRHLFAHRPRHAQGGGRPDRGDTQRRQGWWKCDVCSSSWASGSETGRLVKFGSMPAGPEPDECLRFLDLRASRRRDDASGRLP